MKGLFPGYYRLTDQELSDLWKNCIFVLDAAQDAQDFASVTKSNAHYTRRK
jgi:hypothetical protein